ncbi:MAG: DMT family protein [Muribaculaceae bacterium]|nr:DMT family protein [Muribaculaceae bacterium]
MNTSIWNGLATIGLLLCSNVLMTLAWYGHLKLQQMGVTTGWPLILVILFSWGIAFFEYSFMVPANRIGFVENGGPFSLLQLKVLQECITLLIFTVFVIVFFKNEHLHWNHFVSFLLLIMAVFFAFLKTD